MRRGKDLRKMEMVIPFPAVDLSEKVDKIVSIMNKKIGVSIPLGFPRRISLKDLSISAEKKESC